LSLSNEKKDLFNEMIELLEEDDDVQSIYTNKAN
jgi:transcriptional/translational regulatory protein YebC/TACO1